MKKYSLIIKVWLCTLLLSTSCTSLEEDSTGLLSPDNFYNTIEDLDTGVAASLRSLLRGEGWDGLSVRGWTLVAGADDLTSHRGLNKQRILEADEFIMNSENTDAKLAWKSLYASIASTNLVISNKENVTSNIEKRDQIVGQAHYVRALCYYYLVRWWGDVPLVLQTSIEGLDEMGRTSSKEVYDQIIADATIAESTLPMSWDDAGRPNMYAAKQLLANVYLTMSGYPLKEDRYAEAAAKAKEVIDGGIYKLEPVFADLWAYENRNGQEQVFNLQTAIEEGTAFSTYTSLPYNQWEESGWRDYAAEVNFFKSFPEDERKDATFKSKFEVKRNGVLVNGTPVPKGDFIDWEDSTDGKPGIKKYSDSGTDKRTHVGGSLYPISRYAEVLLIFAEASGPTTDGYLYVNQIRRRAHGLDINTPNASVDLTPGLSVDAFRKEVLQEKAWEFAFEGKRWHDLVRTEMVETANANHPYAGPISKDHYLMPIPADERLVNPNLTQNPGY